MQLVAITPAFYGNRRIRKGQAFEFTGDPASIPRWALPAGQAKAHLATLAQRPADPRPIAAIEASARKRRRTEE